MMMRSVKREEKGGEWEWGDALYPSVQMDNMGSTGGDPAAMAWSGRGGERMVIGSRFSQGTTNNGSGIKPSSENGLADSGRAWVMAGGVGGEGYNTTSGGGGVTLTDWVEEGSTFGVSVAISDDGAWIAIGAPARSRVFVYVWGNGTAGGVEGWVPREMLAWVSNKVLFGYTVALVEGRLIVTKAYLGVLYIYKVGEGAGEGVTFESNVTVPVDGPSLGYSMSGLSSSSMMMNGSVEGGGGRPGGYGGVVVVSDPKVDKVFTFRWEVGGGGGGEAKRLVQDEMVSSPELGTYFGNKVLAHVGAVDGGYVEHVFVGASWTYVQGGGSDSNLTVDNSTRGATKLDDGAVYVYSGRPLALIATLKAIAASAVGGFGKAMSAKDGVLAIGGHQTCEVYTVEF